MRIFINKLINDILRDRNSPKYSVTKTIALSSFGLLILMNLIGLYIMIVNKEIDHFLVGEMIFFILTLLGFKNFSPRNKNSTENEKTEY